MDRNLLMTRIAAIVTTLDETNGSPESMLYIFCEMNMHEYAIIRDILIKADMVTIKSNFVTLTANGKQTAVKLNEVIRNKSN